MSKRAEEAAYNYAKENGTLGYDYNQIYDATKHGYEQAKQDFALTWEDIKMIFTIADNYDSEFNRPHIGSDAYYQEVLRRFNEQKNK